MLLVVVNVPADYSLWPVLKVIMYGRFWVIAEAVHIVIKRSLLVWRLGAQLCLKSIDILGRWFQGKSFLPHP